MKIRSYQLEKLLWREVQDIVPGEIHRVLIPCGALEAHGSSGLGTDTIIPSGIAHEIAKPLDALIAPPVPFGLLGTLRSYPGSVSLKRETYTALLIEIGEGLIRTGFDELVFLNGHSGNHDSIRDACFHLHSEYDVKALLYDWYREPADAAIEIYGSPGGHSGCSETGLVLAIKPDAVNGEWLEEDSGTLNPAVKAYPGPFSIILMEENAGLPDFSKDKADSLLKTVSETAVNSIQRVLSRWDTLDNDRMDSIL